MKTFLFTILTAILVHHTIQYEKAEERQLLHNENSPEEHELDREIVHPLTGLRSASEIKNWVKDMIAMRGRGRGRGHNRPNHTKPTRPPYRPKPFRTTNKPHGGKQITISGSVEITIEYNGNTEEEQVLLEYTPKHKKVDVPMIIFVPLRE